MTIRGFKLDDYGHFNYLDLLMQETQRVLPHYWRYLLVGSQDGETLVVVTADHETGGLTLVDGDLKEGKLHETQQAGIVV